MLPAIHAGCPRIVRTDRGTENTKVAFLQPILRRNGLDSLAGDKSFQFGKSASNQVSHTVYCRSVRVSHTVVGSL